MGQGDRGGLYANFLTAGIVGKKPNGALDVDGAFFLGNLLLLIGDRLGTGSAAVGDDVGNVPKEDGMAVEADGPVGRPIHLVPLGVQDQVLAEENPLDSASRPLPISPSVTAEE